MLYYPGCTLRTQAQNFELSALACAGALGIELKELENWNCCGVVYSLSSDDLFHHIASIRNLIRAQEQGGKEVVTLCAMCYNTLKRANMLVRKDAEKLDKINNLMDREEDYHCGVKVIHLLELLKHYGFARIGKKIKKPIKLKLAPYYGCLLLRPRGVGIDDPEEPNILENLLEAVGASIISLRERTKCCGSYHIVKDPELVKERVAQIIDSALAEEADALVTSCPLCQYNLDAMQEKIPTLYFTQILALALGLGRESCRFELHHVSPISILKNSGVL